MMFGGVGLAPLATSYGEVLAARYGIEESFRDARDPHWFLGFAGLLFALVRSLQRWWLAFHPFAEILPNLRELHRARSPMIFVARRIQSQRRRRG